MSTIDATWIGPYGWRTPDGTVLETGITVCRIPEAEAKGSDYWKPLPKTKTPKDDA